MPFFLGLDVGSTTTKAALVDASGLLCGQAIVPTGAHGVQSAAVVRDAALAQAGVPINDISADALPDTVSACVATGYGRARVAFAQQTITEITCHARAVRHNHPDVRTALDIGGQDAKVIRFDQHGGVDDFVMNDKCAAGTGSFLDMMTRRFDTTFEQLSNLWQEAPEPVDISATCVVFAESEVVGLLADGVPLPCVLAGIHRAIARRIAAMLEQVRAQGPVAFTGGVAHNESLLRDIGAESGLTIFRAAHPQLAGALGAALLAAGL